MKIFVSCMIAVAVIRFALPSAVLAVDCTRSAGGNVTISSSCTFPLSVDGADAGTGTSNTAVVTVGSGATLTVSAGQTVAAGSLDMTSTGSVAIVATGQIKPGTPLYMYDADADGYPKESTMAAQATADPGWRRRNLMTSMTQRDCQDFYNSGYGCVPATNDLTNGTYSGAYQESAGNPALSYHELPADINTAALYHMNEGSDNTCSGGQDICDSSGNGNHGTFNGNAAFTSTAKLGSYGATFDGTGDYVSIGSSPAIDSSDFTLSGWLKTSVSTGAQGLITNDNNGNGIISLRVSTGAALAQVRTTAGTGFVTITGVIVSDGNWHHLAMTRYGNTITLYVDGISGGTGTTVAGDLQETNWIIGARNTADHLFTGSIDEVRISNLARTPEEIKADAQRKPYAIYTAPVNDLGQTPGSWSGMTVKGKGVRTGDGETPHSTNSLVAQWNFNETSGTAAVSGGSCGTSCNGTLTSFASTSSQDQAAGTGWTANNRRWGAGALMFDGTNDYVTVPDNASWAFGSSDFTVETWVRFSSVAAYNYILGQGSTQANDWLLMYNYASDGLLRFVSRVSSDPSISISGVWSPSAGVWYHLSVTRSGNNFTIYVNGNSQVSGTSSGSVPDIADSLNIGRAMWWTVDGYKYFNGAIDSTRIYSRALTASEILANYQAGNIELQTRTSADNSTWEAWKPVTSETALDAVDSLSPVEKISQTSLTAYWKLDETSGTRADSKGSNTLTDNNTVTYAPGRLSNAGQFTSANSEYLSIADNADLSTGDIDFTFSAWVYLDSESAHRTIIGKMNTSQYDYFLWYRSDTDKFYWNVYNGSTTEIGEAIASNFGNVTTNTWYFITAWHDSVNNQVGIQVNNTAPNTAATSGSPGDSTSEFDIGRRALDGNYMDGRIDEVAFWKRTLTAAERTQLFEDGLDLHGAGSGRIYRTSDTTTKIEGTASEKLIVGSPQVDSSTVGLWHLDETSGTGAYIKDSTTNANNGTPTGTTVVDGFYGKARSFNGTSDYITAGGTVTPTGAKTISFWIKTTATTEQGIYDNTGEASARNGIAIYINNTANKITAFHSKGTGGTFNYSVASATSINDGKWHHVAHTWDGTTTASKAILYIDGASDATGTALATTDNTPTYNLRVGAAATATPSNYFNGSLDEIVVSNVVRSAEEIAEAYRAGRNHRLTKTITSTDLSAKTKLPFYVASDRPGTFMEATVGESAFANYEPDANTVGLWHLEEKSGSGVYIKDSSGYGNNGTPTGTTFAQGKIGKGRYFNGTTSDKIVTSATTKGPYSAVTIDGWVYLNSSAASNYNVIAARHNLSAGAWILYIDITTLYPKFATFTASPANWEYLAGASAISTGQWHHLAGVLNGTNKYLYVDGVLIATGTATTSIPSNSIQECIGMWNCTQSAANNEFLNGSADEIRASDIARTPDEIRQAYEIGRRTHPITIDFVTNPQAAYSSGTSVTINNPYGTTALTNTLSVGDTMIFKENVNGTETVSQAAVTAIANTSSVYGTVTLDAAPTFPTGGYSTNAKVFKWQREYFDLTGSLATHRDAITRLTMRVTDGSQGANVWLDDFKSASYINRTTCDTLNTTTGECTYTIPAESVTSTLNRYAQIRAIMSTWDTAVSPIFTSSQIEFGL